MDRNIRIIVIDDEEKLRNKLKILLLSEGYEVSTAGNGREGIEKLNQEAFDLVITDIVMPEVDGYEVMRFVKENIPKLIVIVVTGHTSEESAAEAIKRGAYDYIIKPFDFEVLKAVVKRALEEGKLKNEG